MCLLHTWQAHLNESTRQSEFKEGDIIVMQTETKPVRDKFPPVDIYSPWEQIMKHLSFQTCRDLAELSAAAAASRGSGKRLRAADRSVSAACHSSANARTGSWLAEVYSEERKRKNFAFGLIFFFLI